MNESVIYQKIMDGIEKLNGIKLRYISDPNKIIEIERIDLVNNRIEVLRETKTIKINLDRFRLLSKHLSRGVPVHVDTVFNSGGNDRTLIETIVSHLPNVGFERAGTGENKNKNKIIQWFDISVNTIGELKNISEIDLSEHEAYNLFSFDVRVAKPFLLLSGISGTGKTRFVRQQAEQTGSIDETYCLVPVRPDWHDPSDLLGYISRLGKNGSEFIVTDVLRFIVKAWKGIITDFFETETKSSKLEWIGKPLNQIQPYWLCLDEMNLAPVEQYFSDYLSILETRKWASSAEVELYNRENSSNYEYIYKCDPLLKQDIFSQLNDDGLSALRKSLDLVQDDKLWQYFLQNGISLPFNLIVAGTVNMDETTHGFSRKVIDRAMTIDFGEFFPNDFDDFFEPKVKPKKLSYPVLSNAGLADISTVQADPDGKKTLNFMKSINGVLKDSPFELAFRAFNELLLMVTCFNPETAVELQAVWDDFLMCKVLPRIEGDYEKLACIDTDNAHQTLLMKLQGVMAQSMSDIWSGERPDLLQVSLESDELMVKCRSKKKIDWMQHRLETNSFTSFWP